ncbi:hypothetical protein LIER_34999 [Lithospermum erythrorhizon]|uniref:RING-type domain-containing protein n=1 Tax=Lithospermum erythrorhizon TaxID=34254 RepID=A0AAV3NLI4_LITER
MGGSSSKHNAAPPLAQSGVRRSRSFRSRVLDSSCLRPHHPPSQQIKERATTKRSRKPKHEQPDVGTNELGQSSFFRRTDRSDNNTSSQVLTSRSFNSSANGFASRCRLFPVNISSRLQRSNSLGSSRALCTTPTTFNVSNHEDEVHGCSNASFSPNEHVRPQTCDFLAACFTNQSARLSHENFSSNNQDFSAPSPSFSGNWLDDQILDSAENTRIRTPTHSSFHRNIAAADHFEERHPNRRLAVEEPVDRNAQFSRTLSVGRLRDRVLQRSSFIESALCPFQQDRVVRNASQTSRRTASMGRSEALEQIMVSPISSRHSPSFLHRSPFRSQDYEPGSGDARHLDMLEHRSNFLERRRRIRSQAHALQHLGSRFQHLSGHERSCILSGQHRTGHCTCRVTHRDNNSNNETATRASISRIAMLAEALFEVLDEIHQQTVVLSSRPTVSSIGSIPAPIEVVDSLPVKCVSNVLKHQEDNAQCYICLIEYEEGDMVRILPCHHEFHQICIDKWLKEIHRVCPLCRGDICLPNSASTH